MKADVIAVILNRLRWPQGSPGLEEVDDLLIDLPDDLREAVRRDVDHIMDEGRDERQNRNRLVSEVPEGIVQEIPEFEQDVHDLSGLESLADMLR